MWWLVAIALAQDVNPALVEACLASDQLACRRVGGQHVMAGRHAEAVEVLERNLSLTRVAEPSAVATWASNLASSYVELKDWSRAIALCEEALALRRDQYGQHGITAGSLERLAGVHRSAGEPERAAPLLDEALQMRRAVAPPDHPSTVRVALQAAEVWALVGRTDYVASLLPELRRGLELQRAARPDGAHAETVRVAQLYAATGDLKAARELLSVLPDGPVRTEAFAALPEPPPRSPFWILGALGLGVALLAWGAIRAE